MKRNAKLAYGGSADSKVGISRHKPLKRGRRKPRPLDREAAERWGTNSTGACCAVCGGGCGPVRGHHVLYQQWLREKARTLGLDYELLRWDARNRLWVGEGCHSRHHHAIRRIPRSVLVEHCAGVFEMADGLCLAWRLEVTYPDNERVAKAA